MIKILICQQIVLVKLINSFFMFKHRISTWTPKLIKLNNDNKTSYYYLFTFVGEIHVDYAPNIYYSFKEITVLLNYR
jgi:hypothetical protein